MNHRIYEEEQEELSVEEASEIDASNSPQHHVQH